MTEAVMNPTPGSRIRVTYVIGSLSTSSINRQLARALVKLAPAELELREAPIAGLPIYNYELDDAFPEPARAFKQAIADADAVLLITPEYNRSVPGGLKNAIDWASRPYGHNAFTGKPTAVIGASTGRVGTAAAQQHLKAVMNYSDAVLMNQPEAYVQFNRKAFATDGSVTDPDVAKVLSTYMSAFRDFVVRSMAATAVEPVGVTAGRS
jgi:chromate reductase